MNIRICPVDSTRQLDGDVCTHSPCMNNLGGYCRRPDVLLAEGSTEQVCSLFRVSDSDLHKSLTNVYCTIVADKFFQHFLEVSLLEATSSAFDTVLKSQAAFDDWNKSSFTFDQVADAIKLIRSRL